MSKIKRRAFIIISSIWIYGMIALNVAAFVLLIYYKLTGGMGYYGQ